MENCQLCLIPKNESYRLIKENNSAFSCIILEPLIDSHILVLPKDHIKSLNDLTEKESKDFLSLIEEMNKILKNKFNEDPITIMNHGKHSTQEHLHFHMLTTKGGIRNFMSTYLNCPERKKLSPEELKNLADNIKSFIDKS
ncbi:HIT family protein [Candidatus Woesearchaeota archaeon]|nr:HIT family protein [Candidatus Woesearchaeota archaeon]